MFENFFSVKNITKQLQCDFEDLIGSDHLGWGKFELSYMEDESQYLKLKMYDLPSKDSLVSLVVGDRTILEQKPKQGKLRIKLKYPKEASVELAIGDRLEVYQDGIALMAGEVYLD